MNKISKKIEAYENATWFRALVQLAPCGAGGAVDVLLSGKSAAINQRRVNKLLEEISTQIEELSDEKLNKQFLASDEFFEIFRTSAEIAAHSSDADKRKTVAAYLSGRVRCGVLTNLSAQVLEDIRSMQPIHFQVLAVLPPASSQVVNKTRPSEALMDMPAEVYEKCMSDLERFGFIRYCLGSA